MNSLLMFIFSRMNAKQLLLSVLFLASLISILLLLGCSSSYDVAPFANQTQPRGVTEHSSIIFVSDTQSPLWIEKLKLKADNNEKATQYILRSIAQDATCTALFHLGDITALGSSQSYWGDFDTLSQEIRNAGIPIYPAFGNHEYMPFSGRGKENMIERFPFLAKQSWYTKRIGSVAIILLNSNFSELSDDEIASQTIWYEKTVKELEVDSSVSAIIIGCHHSPYTNSTIVTPSTDVQKMFVPAYIKSKKAKLFITGHAHAFEHFIINSKDFLIIGGGGGLLQPLLLGNNQRWEDKFHGEVRRFFHFARILPRHDALEIQIQKVNKDCTGLETAYELNIPFGDKNAIIK